MIQSYFSRASIAASAVFFSLLFALPASAAGWVDLNVAGLSNAGDMSFSSDKQKGIVIGFGAGNIWYTADGGKTWAASGSNGLSSAQLNAVSFAPSSDVAYFSGYNGALGKTTNGGATVVSQSSSVTGHFHDVFAIDQSRAWAVGSDGKMARTTTGGSTWEVQTAVANETFTGVFFVTPDRGWAVTTSGKIFYTINGATANVNSVMWNPQTEPTSESLEEVYFVNESTGFVIGHNKTLLRTTNGGGAWTQVVISDVAVPPTTHLWSIYFEDGQNGIIGGSQGILLTTDDAGAGGFARTNAPTSGDVSGVFLKGSDMLLAMRLLSPSNLHRYDSVAPTNPTSLRLESPGSVSSMTKDSTPTFLWNASTDGETGVSSYEWSIKLDIEAQSSLQKGGGAGTSATASEQLSDGTYYFSAFAEDLAGNKSSTVNFMFTIDTVAPTVGSITANPSSIVEDSSVTFSASASDNKGVSGCVLLVNSQDVGAAQVAGGTASKPHAFANGGTYSVAMRCTDTAGNVTTGPTYTANVASNSSSDTIVSTSMSSVGVSPSSVTADGVKTAMVTVIVRNGSNQALSGKTVTLASSLGGVTITPGSASTDSSGTATFTVKSSTQGSATLTATADGKALDGKPTVTFTAPIQAQCQNPVVPVGSLVKLPDDGNLETQIDSAVYYYGADCKRHAFPNPKVYFTWYTDFNGVVIVDANKLASMQLGKNVTYRPGVKMVKFTTDNNVYAVSKGGVLRWVKTEAIATALYGSTWNKQIDDVSDAFYINYTFGTDINDASNYNRNAEMAGAATIDDSL